MIKINLNLFAGLESYSQEGLRKGNIREVGENTTVTDLLDQLSIPGDEIQIILVNGEHQSTDYQLKEGDELSLFPPIGGG